MTRQIVFLEGLGCPSCAAQLEQAAGKMAGIKAAEVAFGPGTLTVEYDPQQVAEADIARLVERFGLTVATVIAG